MNRTALRLTGFVVLLALLFTGGWAVGEQFPTDDEPTHQQMDHGSDAQHGTQNGTQSGTQNATGRDVAGATP